METTIKYIFKAICGLGILLIIMIIMFLAFFLTGCTSQQVDEVGEILEGEGKLIEEAVEASQMIQVGERPHIRIISEK